MTIFCSLETFDSVKECNGEKKTNYKSKVQKAIRLWISFFEIRQVLNKDILKVSVFETKVFLQIVRIWEDIFTARQNLSQQFYQSLDFETFSLQCVQFWTGEEKMCPTSSQFFKTRQSLIGDFYSVPDIVIIFRRPSIFEPKELQSIRFRKKTLILGEQSSLENRLHKVNFWCQFTP